MKKDWLGRLPMTSNKGIKEKGKTLQKGLTALTKRISLGLIGSIKRAITTQGGGDSPTLPKQSMWGTKMKGPTHGTHTRENNGLREGP